MVALFNLPCDVPESNNFSNQRHDEISASRAAETRKISLIIVT
jgi:hypothetical protein